MTVTPKQGTVDLVVVGSIGIDSIATPAAEKSELLGGSVSYACAAASFFGRVGMVGIVGSDFPTEYVDLYREFGIDLAGLQHVQGRTFRWSGVYDDDMINRRTLSTDLNVFADFTPELPESYRAAPFFLLGNISPELQLHVLGQAKRPRFVVADTMDLWIDTARDALMDVIKRVNMLMLNDGEARLLTGERNLRRSGERIREWGPEYVVIKKGEHGAMLLAPNGPFLVPAYPLDDVQDPTGAGDSFAGGFMGQLVRRGAADEEMMREALLYGATIASLGVEAFSLDRFVGLGFGDIETRLGELRAMTAVTPGA